MLSIFIDGVEERDFSNVMDGGNKHTGGVCSEIPAKYGKLYGNILGREGRIGKLNR